MGGLHHILDEPEHSVRYHSVLHCLQAVPGQGDQRDSVQELSAKCETEEQAHTHRQHPINEQPDQRNYMKQPSNFHVKQCTDMCCARFGSQCNTECFTVYMVHYQKDLNLQLISKV